MHTNYSLPTVVEAEINCVEENEILGNRGSGRGSYRDRSAILLNSLSMAGRRRSLRK